MKTFSTRFTRYLFLSARWPKWQSEPERNRADKKNAYCPESVRKTPRTTITEVAVFPVQPISGSGGHMKRRQRASGDKDEDPQNFERKYFPGSSAKKPSFKIAWYVCLFGRAPFDNMCGNSEAENNKPDSFIGLFCSRGKWRRLETLQEFFQGARWFCGWR